MRMKFRALICLAMGLLLSLTLLPPCLAQVTGATLSGTVTDKAKSLIPNASITITNLAQGTTRSTTTNANGDFTLPNVAPGDYKAEISANGFQKEVRTNLTLTVGQTQTLNIALNVGLVSEVVQVDESTTQVELGSSAMSAVVQGEVARALPLNGRDWTQLAALEPGTVTVRSQNSAQTGSSRGNRGYGQQLSIAGGRPQLNNYRIDGIIANDYDNSAPGSTAGLALGVDAIGEFSVISSNYSASYGMTGGGVINAITRSGTNQLHGSAYEFVRNDFFDARGYFDASKLPFHRNQFGFTLGGPVIRDKLFLFGNYEGLRNIYTTTALPTVPTASAKAGTFGGVTYKVDPAVVPYLGIWAAPNYAIKTDTGTYRFASRAVTPENFVTMRADYNISPKDQITSTYLWDDGTTTQPDTLNVKLQESVTDRALFSLSWNHTFTGNLYNSIRVGADREWAGSLINLPGANPIGTDNTLGAQPGLDAPVIGVGSGISSFSGGVTGGAQSGYGWTTPQLTDDAFWNKGSHSIRFGVLVDHIMSNLLIQTYNYGNYTFTSWPNFLTNNPGTLTVTTTPPTPIDLRQNVFGGYVEDSWKIRPNLTLTYGVRYEMATVPTETKNRLAELRDPASTQLYLGSPLFNNPTKKNFEPRLGFSYSPDYSHGTTIVSGGYGLYDVLPLTYLFNLQLSQVGPYSNNLINRTTNLNTGAPVSLQGLFPKAAATLLINNPADAAVAESYIQFNAPRNYVQEYNLTFQQQFPAKLSLKAGYVGSHGTHQNMATADANSPIPLVNTKDTLIFPCSKAGTTVAGAPNEWVACAASSAGPKRNPAYGQIIASGWFASSNYSGLLLQVSQRLKSVQWQSSFTWEKALDNSSSVTAQNPYQNSLIQYLYHPIKGLSDYNLPRVFVNTFIWHLPKPVKDTNGLQYLLNGWEISGIYQASDGAPFSMVMAGDTLGLGSVSPLNLPDRITGPGCSGNPVTPGNRLSYVKLNCFAVHINPAGQTQLGNAGRNELRGPAFQQLDISLMKNFYLNRWGDGRRLELRGDAFNIVNHPNLDPPYTNDSLTVGANGALVTAAGSTSAGQITSNEIPRQIQVSARFVF